jgi:hypothetical protein
MSRFWKRFLREGQGLFARGGRPKVWLGAFGKHPGWDDHIDDIGLETESLLFAKQILYVEGIGGQIDSGEWERLDEAQRLREFKHVFLWKRGEAFLMGRIWSSRDGKNRTQYPMVVCAHCLSIPFNWALTNVSQCLEGIEGQCKSTRLAQEVQAIIRQSLEQLRRSVAHVDGESLFKGPDARGLVDRLGLDEDYEGVFRILYCICTELGGYVTVGKGKGERDLGSGQIRLPSVVGLSGEALSFWSRFLERLFQKNVPLLLTLPLEQPWVDATCGEPVSRQFYSLRANSDVLSVASEVTCEVPREFRKAHKGLVQAIIDRIPGSDSESG